MNNKIVALATELAQLKLRKEELSTQEKQINIRIEEITKQLLPEAMDESGVSNIKIDGVGRISLRGEVYASINVESRGEAYSWLRATGRGSLITETVSSSSLKAAAKEWLRQGDEIPECIKVTPCTIAVLTKV